MNPGKMRDQLMIMFPHKSSIPSETKIKKIHQFGIAKAQVQKQKKKNSSEQRGRKPKGSSHLKSRMIISVTVRYCAILYFYNKYYSVPE